MEIAEEADEASVLGPVHEHIRRFRLGHRALGLDALPGRVDRLEIAPVEADAPILAGEHGVGLRSRGNEHRARREFDRLRSRIAAARQAQRGGVAVAIEHDFRRAQTLGEAHALLHRLGDFLVVQRIARRLGEAAAIGDRRAAPAL